MREAERQQPQPRRQQGRHPRSSTSLLDEAMAVNHVIREYPATKRVLDRLFVNVPYEGCDGLDEVAWRRGMEARDLVSQLEEVITSGDAAGLTPPSRPHPTTRA